MAEESDLRFQRLVESAPDAIIITDRAGRIKLVNHQAEVVFGYDAEELLGQPHDILLPDRYQSAHEKHRADYLSDSSTRPMGTGLDLVGRRKDGSEFPVEISLSPLASGGRIDVISIVRDITDYKHADEALRRSQKSLAKAQRIAHLGNWEWDITDNILWWSDEMYRIFGVTQDEFGGVFEYFFSRVHKEDRDRVQQAVDEALYEGKIYEEEYRVVVSGGGIRYVLAQGEVSRDESGAPSRMVGTVLDITERKKAELLHHGQNRVLRQLAAGRPLFEILGDLVWVMEVQVEGMLGSVLLLDEDSQTLRFGSAPSLPAAYNEAIDGVQIGPDVGSCGRAAYTKRLVVTEDIGKDPAWEEFRSVAISHGLQACWSHPIISSAGRVLGTFAMYYRKPRRPTGAELKLISSAADLAAIAIERIRTDRELTRHREDLEKLVAERTEELTVALEKAREADKLKSAFLACMSHELRTPLNSIIGFTGILLKGFPGPLNEEQTRQLGMVRGSAHHLLKLINDVLDISKIEAEQLEVAWEPFDLRQAVQNVAQTITPQAEEKGLALVIRVSPQVGEVVGDQMRFEQVVLNLLHNAVKFSSEGEVRLDCRIRGGDVEIHVKDDGIGIDPGDLDKVFEAFRQIETGVSRRYEGTGLGLSICRKLVGLMGGEIHASSEGIGKGSTFTFILPVKRERGEYETEDPGHRR